MTRPSSIRTRLVVQALCVWNGVLAVIVGALFLLFADRPAGVVVAAGCAAAAAGLFALARWAGRGTGWNY